MNFTQIEYFLSLASSKSFKTTAELLNVSTPAVSKQISLLEKEWGFALFKRNYKDVELTRSGQIMYDVFMKFSQSYSDSLLTAHQNSEDQNPVISVGIIEKLNLDYVFRGIYETQLRFPDVTLYIVTAPASELVLRHTGGPYDIVITHEQLMTTTNHVERQIITRLEYALYISSYHPYLKEIRNGHIELERLFYLGKKDSSNYKSDFQFITSLYGFRPKEIIPMPNLDSILLGVNGCGGKGYGGITFLDTGIVIPPDYHLEALPAGVYFNEVITWPHSPNKNDVVTRVGEEMYREIKKQQNKA